MRDHVDVVVEDHLVRIFHGTHFVATHARSTEPFARVVDVAHYAGFWRSALDDVSTPGLAPRRELADYPPLWTVANERGDSCTRGRAAHAPAAPVRRRPARCRLNDAARTEPTYLDFLDGVLRQEVDAKQRTRVAMGLKIAHFPTVKTLDDFDFKFQPSVDQRLVRELATAAFSLKPKTS